MSRTTRNSALNEDDQPTTSLSARELIAALAIVKLKDTTNTPPNTPARCSDADQGCQEPINKANNDEPANDNDTPNAADDPQQASSSVLRYGKCKWFNVAKGWGFITPNDDSQDVFVHQSVIQMDGFRSLAQGEDIAFESCQTERGIEATLVSGRTGDNCQGSTFHPNKKSAQRRVRCYNCGQFANHIASMCELGPQPKRCHQCRQEDHLFADCPLKKVENVSTNVSVNTSANTSANESALSAASCEWELVSLGGEDGAQQRPANTADAANAANAADASDAATQN